MPIWIVLSVPLAFFVLDGLGNWMMNCEGFRLKDWHMGFDAALAALTSALASLPDKFSSLTAGGKVQPDAKYKMAEFSAYCVFAVVGVFATMLIHHDVAQRKQKGVGSEWLHQAWMLLAANSIGFASLACFLLLVK